MSCAGIASAGGGSSPSPTTPPPVVLPPPPPSSPECPPPPKPPCPNGCYSDSPPSSGSPSPPNSGTQPFPLAPPNQIVPYFPYYYYAPPGTATHSNSVHLKMQQPFVSSTVLFIITFLCFF
ncbi:branchpoint-bridging protein-like [Corylus avellana]|uniref:branchpoint-bridging protein-like n=1 Tax=Corylus avellana TaxID=13451 RepID=UPI001E226D4D|nr:branchpoint-bridging protein-like [Corylus avellana]